MRETTPTGGDEAADPDAARLRHVLRHVSTNLAADLRVPALAARAGMSPSCFSRWFRAQTGVTPHAYVLEQRLDLARRLLRESELPLIEVALAAGFSSQSCLNVVFRRRARMTPAEFRARSRKAKDAGGPPVERSSSPRALEREEVA